VTLKLTTAVKCAKYITYSIVIVHSLKQIIKYTESILRNGTQNAAVHGK